MIKFLENNVHISPVKKVEGIYNPPPDKSISHRAAIFSGMSIGSVEISNFLFAKDTMATLGCLKALGVQVEEDLAQKKVVIKSGGLDSFVEPSSVLNAENSATTMRLFAGLLSAKPFLTVLSGDKYLNRRPMKRIIEPLALMGACIVARRGGYPPLAVFGKKLKGIEYELKIPSAQVKSAVILAALQAEGKTRIIEKVRSRDHTERMLSWMGVKISRSEDVIEIDPSEVHVPSSIEVPGDPSSAAFFVVAGVLSKEGEVRVQNVCLNETRIGYIRVLQRAGAKIQLISSQEFCGEPVGDIIVKPSPELNSLTVEPQEVPSMIDEIPVLAVAAAFAKGESRFYGLDELRYKESDRLSAVALNLQKLGADVEVFKNNLFIKGKEKLEGSEIESYGDHRIAMAFSIAGLFADGGTLIKGADCVSISYPQFYEDLMLLIG